MFNFFICDIPGEKEANKTACMMILAKVVDDPQSGTCLNVSYADVSGPVANYNPTGSPYANQQPASAFNASTASLNSSLGSVGQSLMLNGGLNLSLNLASPMPIQNINPTLTAQLLDHIKVWFGFYDFTRRNTITDRFRPNDIAFFFFSSGLSMSSPNDLEIMFIETN